MSPEVKALCDRLAATLAVQALDIHEEHGAINEALNYLATRAQEVQKASVGEIEAMITEKRKATRTAKALAELAKPEPEDSKRPDPLPMPKPGNGKKLA